MPPGGTSGFCHTPGFWKTYILRYKWALWDEVLAVLPIYSAAPRSTENNLFHQRLQWTVNMWPRALLCLPSWCLDVAVPRTAAVSVRPILHLHERWLDHHRRSPRRLRLLHLPGHQRSRKRDVQGAPGSRRRCGFGSYSVSGKGRMAVGVGLFMR